MNAKKTFIKTANKAARDFYLAEKKPDVTELRWMEVQERIRQNLVLIRNMYGMSQKHCADLLGLNPKYVNAMENGRYYASLRCVWLFSQMFYIPIGLLVEHEWGEEENQIWVEALMKIRQLKEKYGQVYETIRHNLMTLRYYYCLNQNETAALLGLSNSYMWALENGRYHMSFPIAYAVSRLFNMTMDDFIYHRFKEEDFNPFDWNSQHLNPIPKEEWMKVNKAAASNIKKLRIKKGLSVQQLADAIGYGRDAIYKMEQGKTFLRLSIVIDLTQYLNIDIDSLLKT